MCTTYLSYSRVCVLPCIATRMPIQVCRGPFGLPIGPIFPIPESRPAPARFNWRNIFTSRALAPCVFFSLSPLAVFFFLGVCSCFFFFFLISFSPHDGRSGLANRRLNLAAQSLATVAGKDPSRWGGTPQHSRRLLARLLLAPIPSGRWRRWWGKAAWVWPHSPNRRIALGTYLG
ncbi:hypothetical protein GGS23DRAFT_377338 [Durotheca rogersii]|uniref:uncharacterized protein n=1 Tax=Durotheca rogersii TaxID=419775 RepID=UPI00222091A5|nr:uncharacterized protein GGS23DRAFT_377338 [Durotheca rogersii]KAI5866256.1 hypothetical protein GGS23DRAFT_377338 [Durotheca rogersii]